jgi:hypothetical protein
MRIRRMRASGRLVDDPLPSLRAQRSNLSAPHGKAKDCFAVHAITLLCRVVSTSTQYPCAFSGKNAWKCPWILRTLI